MSSFPSARDGFANAKLNMIVSVYNQTHVENTAAFVKTLLCQLKRSAVDVDNPMTNRDNTEMFDSSWNDSDNRDASLVRLPDDWDCSKCGAVNFGIRTECFRRKCGAPRDDDNESETSDNDYDVSALYADDDFKDFTFYVDDKKFKVHKCVFACASPVFKTMFTCGLDETKLNSARVDDCDPDIFERLIKFVYTGKPPEDLRSISMELYELAHRYDIPNLLKICLQDIKMIQIDDGNAFGIYAFSIKFEMENLLRYSWAYIKR